MVTALEVAIGDLSDSAVPVPDALRRLLVVSRRIDASDLTEWLRGELNGYPAGMEVPAYRKGDRLPIKLQFDGPMGSSVTRTLHPAELVDQLADPVRGTELREPVAELQALVALGADPQRELPLAWTGLYRRLAGDGKAPAIPMMVLNHAAITVPRTHLSGILDRVKSNALDLALSLEDISPEAGGAGGPTVTDEPRIAREVQVHMTQIFAADSTITVGDNATVASREGATAIRVEAGDIAGLLQAAAGYVDDDAVRSLAQALEADGDRPAMATRTFMDRVKAGGYSLASGITSNAAYAGMVALIRQAFPGTFQ